MSYPYVPKTLNHAWPITDNIPHRTWHTQRRNIDRSNAIIKRLATTYRDMTGTVPAIAALNECVEPNHDFPANRI